ncbi:MAG: HD domain-containing protein [Chitinophagales bacterium]
MNSEELVSIIRTMVEEQCKMDTNMFGYGIWKHHIIYVVKYSKLLAEKLGADQEVVEISALLHDYASIKDKSLYEEHHLHGATEAEDVLKKFNYPEEKINKVKDCIIQHRGSKNFKKTTKEAVCIASADAMAHIDQIPSLLHLAYAKRNLGVNEGASWVLSKIERSWNKLCPEAKEMISKKYESAKTILKCE